VRRVISQHAGDYGTIIYGGTRLRLRRGKRGGRSGGNAGRVSPATTPIPLVLDQGLPRDTASILRQGGHDYVHVGEIGMSSAADREIIAWAREHRRTVVTLDADFHAEMAVYRALNPSVIRLRFQRLDGPAVAQLVRFVVAEYGAALVHDLIRTIRQNIQYIAHFYTGGVPGRHELDDTKESQWRTRLWRV
jgi:predicted nuclease of predicted toxin-antitoxin system